MLLKYNYSDMDSLTFKKNNIDELFLNLADNPKGQKNKDFKYVLSLVYELIEEEFADTYDANNTLLKNTDILIQPDNTFFITPPYGFDYFLKSKGSLYRLKSTYINEKEGYLIPVNMLWEYFTGLDETGEIKDATETFSFYFNLTQFVKKTVEKLNFIPSVKFNADTFHIVWQLYLKNADFKEAYKNITETSILDKELTKKLIDNYLNYLIFNFLSIKHNRFSGTKTAMYFAKNTLHRRTNRPGSLENSISEWLDEIFLGKYDIVPLFDVEKINDEKFLLKIKAKNKKSGEIFEPEALNEADAEIIEKQILYAQKYLEELEDVNMELDLAGVYKIMTKISFYLTRAGMEISLPADLSDVIVPRASINAKVKENREKDLDEMLNFTNDSSVSVSSLMDFSISVALGDENISIEEYEALAKDADGLIRYKNKYLLVDKAENDKLFKRLKNPEVLSLNKNELLHALLSGKIDEYDFDYDEAFSRVVSEFTRVEDIDIPENLNGTLRPYQIKGFKWLYTNTSKGFGCCMADDMGLGKTVQVISLILKLKNDKKLKKPVLVVCPTTLIGNWERELQNFAPDLTFSTYHAQDRKLNLNCDVILTTYAILRIDLNELKEKTWSMVVIDEAQNVKNPDTSQSQAVKSLKTDIKIAMTGTPVENRLSELWSIFDFINKGYLGTLHDFQKSYAMPIEKLKEENRAKRLKLAISPFMLRRLKTDKKVITDLPEKVILDDYCYLTKQQALLYERVLNQSMQVISNEAGISRRGHIFKLITSLKQICNHPYHYLKHGDMSKDISGKAQKFISVVDNIIDNNEKVLVFTQYKEMGDILKDMIMSEFDHEPLFFHGSLNRAQREDMIKEFGENDKQKVMILSLKAGGMGLNLTSATNVIHYDLWWNPAVEDQATDRTYRIGQDKNVMVHRFITLSTFEEKIDKMIKEKRNLADMAVFEGEKIITELSDDEIYEIFSLNT